MKKTLLKLVLFTIILAIIACKKDDAPANIAPIVADQTFSVAEDIASNTPFATVVATDENELTFTITTNSNDLFTINNTGELSLVEGKNLDFETATTHIIALEVFDGELTTRSTITVVVEKVSIDLSSKTWEVIKLKEKDASIFTNADKGYSIEFKTDGTCVVSGTNTCVFNYMTEDNLNISISNTACTEIAGASFFEELLFSLFPKTANFMKDGKELILMGDGEIILKAI